MYIEKISIANFKNYENIELELSPKVNGFTGLNGTGKTNFLDAIHYLSFTKSYFNQVDTQNIRHGADFFAIHADWQVDGKSVQLSCIQKRGVHKQFKINQKEYERLADHIGLFPAVMISPYDTDLVREGSEIRRKFMNMMISQIDRTYLEDTIMYNKVLEQRNLLLKSPSIEETLLEAIDLQMEKYAVAIYKQRKAFFETFIPIFQHYYHWISLDHENIDISYESSLSSDMPFTEQLQQAFQRDRMLQYSTCGIHKDDLDFKIAGFSAKKTASQGQQKSIVIALRLAQFDIIKQKNKVLPILLLDDIFDKLDLSRVDQLMELVCKDDFGQVFITDTDLHRLGKLLSKHHADSSVFRVEDGQISAC